MIDTTKPKSETIEDFLSNFTSSSTIRGYRCHLNQYFKVIDENPDTYIKDVRKMENGERIDALDNYEKDIKKYWKWLINNEYSPKTVYNATNCTRVFFKQYRIKLDDIVWENMSRRGTGNKPIVKDKPITKEILRSILEHGNAKARAVILVMASSGMRESEVVHINPSDIDWNSNPVKIDVRHVGRKNQNVKTKYSRYTFITPEAALALKEWQKQRDKMLELSSRRCNLPNAVIDVKDKRVFPWRPNNIIKIWNSLLEKSEYLERDERTDRRVYHVHGLRKYFRSRLSKHDRDIAELLMGHKGYLSENYLRLTPDEVKKAYQDGMQHLMIYETSVDSERVDNLEDKLKTMTDENKTLKDEIRDVKLQLLEIRADIYEKKEIQK